MIDDGDLRNFLARNDVQSLLGNCDFTHFLKIVQILKRFLKNLKIAIEKGKVELFF